MYKRPAIQAHFDELLRFAEIQTEKEWEEHMKEMRGLNNFVTTNIKRRKRMPSKKKLLKRIEELEKAVKVEVYPADNLGVRFEKPVAEEVNRLDKNQARLNDRIDMIFHYLNVEVYHEMEKTYLKKRR